MIHYQLRCSRDHEFDGWFRDSAAFDRQASRALVECPVCADTDVQRALMAPALGRSRGKSRTEPAAAPDAAPAKAVLADPAPAAPSERMPGQVRAVLQRLRAEVERNCDYVGPAFAEEARRIHAGDSARRGIYGETTPEQAESLADDGIEVSRIPWLPRADG